MREGAGRTRCGRGVPCVLWSSEGRAPFWGHCARVSLLLQPGKLRVPSRGHRAAPGARRGLREGRTNAFPTKLPPAAALARDLVPKAGWCPRSCRFPPGERGCPRDGGIGAPNLSSCPPSPPREGLGKISRRPRRTVPKFLRGQQSAPPPVYLLRCRIALLMI